MFMKKKVKVAFIGVGAISGIYLQNIIHTFHDVEVCGVCDLIPERAQAGIDYVKEQIAQGADAPVPRLYADMYEAFNDPEVEVIPGLTAACSGGALLGAPLTHDFAVISLSNRLTPWEKIAKRLECAAMADLGIVLYNPRSKGRPDNLRMACDILLKFLPADRPCGVAHYIGREGEEGFFMTLMELRDADIDMFSTVFIGNAQTKMIAGRMVTPRGYKDV